MVVVVEAKKGGSVLSVTELEGHCEEARIGMPRVQVAGLVSEDTVGKLRFLLSYIDTHLCHYATLFAIWKSTASAHKLLLVDFWAAQTSTATNIPTCTPTPPSTVIVGLSASALARNEGPVICEANVRWMRCSEA